MGSTRFSLEFSGNLSRYIFVLFPASLTELVHSGMILKGLFSLLKLDDRVVLER